MTTDRVAAIIAAVLIAADRICEQTYYARGGAGIWDGIDVDKAVGMAREIMAAASAPVDVRAA